MQERIRFAGPSRYGIMTAAKTLLESAVVFEDKHAVLIPDPEGRSGATDSWVEVAIADARILDLRARSLSCLAVLSPSSLAEHLRLVAEDGPIIVPQHLAVGPVVRGRLIQLPFHRLMGESEDHDAQLMALAALGAVVGATNVVSQHSLESALALRAARGEEEVFLEALNWGARKFRQDFGWQR